ncbi:MAG: 2OG-Fe(II) oxygenase [Pseudomonadota bacterium]
MTAINASSIIDQTRRALSVAQRHDEPYPHWLINKMLPDAAVAALQTVALPIAELEGVSGKRELHNDTRHYVDEKNRAAIPVFAALGDAYQNPQMVGVLERFFGASLVDTFLRIEYAQDVSGFWLQPHTDLGVKKLTMLIYLSDDPAHENLGTDIYNADKTWAKRSPFKPNLTMAFVPGDATYHGFEQREISGVRKSLILNYVTKDWRDREQLAFPSETVTAA